MRHCKITQKKEKFDLYAIELSGSRRHRTIALFSASCMERLKFFPASSPEGNERE